MGVKGTWQRPFDPKKWEENFPFPPKKPVEAPVEERTVNDIGESQNRST